MPPTSDAIPIATTTQRNLLLSWRPRKTAMIPTKLAAIARTPRVLTRPNRGTNTNPVIRVPAMPPAVLRAMTVPVSRPDALLARDEPKRSRKRGTEKRRGNKNDADCGNEEASTHARKLISENLISQFTDGCLNLKLPDAQEGNLGQRDETSGRDQ